PSIAQESPMEAVNTNASSDGDASSDGQSGNDDSLDCDFDGLSFLDGLRLWALSTNQTHRALNSLLELLRNRTDFSVPKDARALLRTPTNTAAAISRVDDGRLWHHGITNCLQAHFRQTIPEHEEIWADFSMDGLPLHKSGPAEFWSIIMKLCQMPDVPVMYLRSFVAEMNELQENGVLINGCNYKVRIRAIIADSPVRFY
uniref:Uncharacterized protein n=1 Tax=Anopheles funestus TaxID=62324 RepID=A0A182S057_ANOFN